MSSKLIVNYHKDKGYSLPGGSKVDFDSLKLRAKREGIDLEVINETDRSSDYTIRASDAESTSPRKNADNKQKK